MLSPVPESLAWAHPLVQEWFINKFGTPTEPQEQGWPHILAGLQAPAKPWQRS